MTASTISRLLFFGGRFFSLLLVARLLGTNAADFLLAVAILEFFRIVFDYGLENSVLARAHQHEGTEGRDFARSKAAVRLAATVIGQGVSSGATALWCLQNNVPMALPLVASLQFTCLMGFGYLQAHLQTGQPGGMAALICPLATVIGLQGVLLILAYDGRVAVWLCAISFEVMALVATVIVASRFERSQAASPAASSVSATEFDFSAFRKVLLRIAPLGNVALIGVAYTRADALVVSWVASGALLTQYLIYQRLASAPLMFFSTIASVNIAALSDARACPDALPEKVIRYRRLAYAVAAASGITLAAISPLIAAFFLLENTDTKLLGLQSLVLALQISNGFHAALMIALQESAQLWSIARNNTLLAVVLLPLCAWISGAIGVALALCLVELFCAAQYVWLFSKASPLVKQAHVE